MSSRTTTVLTCDACGGEAEIKFRRPDRIRAWMHANGWTSAHDVDLCPACAETNRPTPTNGDT